MAGERHKIMPWDMFLKICSDIRQFDEQIKVINLYASGEPLLNKELPRMIRYLKDNDLCGEVRTTTNASLMNPMLNQKLVDAGIDLVRVSIESLYEEDYEKICGIKINYEEFLSNIKDFYIRSRGKVKLTAKVITAAFHNNEDVGRFFEIYKPIVDFIYVQRILGHMWSDFEEIVITNGGSDYHTEENMIKEGCTICAFPLTTMTVHSNGVIGVCAMDWKYGTRYGHVNEMSLKDAWNTEKLRQMRLKHLEGKRSEIPYCRGCDCVSDDKIDHVAGIIAKRLITPPPYFL
jgi:MoaA/NifB/PqqE/SkfB family radical SAM enzyme